MTKYQIFTILPQILHFHKNRNLSSIFTTFLDQLVHPYKFYGRDMSGIFFFIFASCELLNSINTINLWRYQTCTLYGSLSRSLSGYIHKTIHWSRLIFVHFSFKFDIIFDEQWPLKQNHVLISYTPPIRCWKKCRSEQTWRNYLFYWAIWKTCS